VFIVVSVYIVIDSVRKLLDTPSYRFRVFENRVLRRVFGPKREWWDAGEDCIMKSFITFTLHQNIIREIKSRRLRWTGHIARMAEMRKS
jgi:hypothetical protein